MINKDVMVYSVPRTGSTFIWRCLTKIFTKVLKAHRDRIWDYSPPSTRTVISKYEAVLDYSWSCVITERDSMDSFLSQWRNDNWQSEAHFHEWLCIAYGDDPRFPPRSGEKYVGWTRKNDESQVFNVEKFKEVCDARTEACYIRNQFKPVRETVRSIREIMVTFRRHLEDLEKVKREYAGPVLVLQYEQFWDDYDYIFSNFEEFFKITLSEETKTEIKNTTNRSATQSAQEALKGVAAHDTESHIHGGHVFLAEPGYSKKVLGEKNLARMQKLLTCDFEEIMDIDLEE